MLNSVPLYKEVRDQIVRGLVRNEWLPGDVLPSEKELAKRFSVAISTIRAAVGDLVSANVLVRKQGKGTFVAHHSNPMQLYRFFNVVRNHGGKEPFMRKLMSMTKERADHDAIRVFGLTDARRGGDVYRIRVRLSATGSAFAVAEVILPVHLFPNLKEEHIPDGPQGLYAVYQEKYGVNIVRVVEELFAVKASAKVARALSLEAGEPLLEVRRTGYTFNDVAVEQRTTWIHTANYHYHVSQGATG